MLSEAEIYDVYKSGPEAVIALVKGLLDKIESQGKEIQKLTERVLELESQINKNSGNSSKPPSSDGLKRKLKSLRTKGQRKVGGQEGHPGYTLEFSQTPAEIWEHTPEKCDQCGEALTNEAISQKKRRQVFELPQIELEVSEHQSCMKVCPRCTQSNWGTFPESVKNPVQYGPRFQSFLVYLNQYQLLPYERSRELMEVLCGHGPSTGSLSNAVQRCSELLIPFESDVKESLKQAKVLNLDETGIRVNGKLHWLHVSSTDEFTWYQADPKRGQEAMERIGILPGYQGTAIHDHWKPYFRYTCEHGLCNAHHLRELKHIAEQYQQPWASSLSELLLEIKKATEEETLTLQQLQDFQSRYDSVLLEGLALNPSQTHIQGKRGRTKQTPARNLLERLHNYRTEVLRFMTDQRVPFDNNQAERDVRMAKVQQKISGCFRSNEGADAFARIRSFLSTLKKQGRFILDELVTLFQGNYLFPCPT